MFLGNFAIRIDGTDPPRLPLLRGELILERRDSASDSLHLAREWDSLKRDRVDCAPGFLIRSVRAQTLEMERREQIFRFGLLCGLVRVECVAIWVREVWRVDVRLRTVGRRIIAVEFVWQGQRRAVRGEGERGF